MKILEYDKSKGVNVTLYEQNAALAIENKVL